MNMKLKRAGFFKDGGSIGAEFEKDDGTPFNVFLEISPNFWSENKKVHRRLFSCLANETESAQPIVKNSAEEAVILKTLEDWVSSNASHSCSDVFCILELIPAIRQREPEPIVGENISLKEPDKIELNPGILGFEVRMRLQPIVAGLQVLREDIDSIFNKIEEEEISGYEERRSQIFYVLDIMQNSAQQIYDLTIEYSKRLRDKENKN